MAKHVPEIEILGPEDARARERTIKARFWPTVKRALRVIPFMDEVVAGYYAMLDPATPTRARLILIGALAYFVSPIDVVPDFIVALGFLDDAAVLAAALGAVRSSITEDHREAARRALRDDQTTAGKP